MTQPETTRAIVRRAVQKYKHSFVRGYCLETGLCFLSLLLSKNKTGNKWNGPNILSIFISKNHIKIANSLGLAAATYQILLKKVFKISDNDENRIIKHITSSFIATFWLYYITPKYRQRISTYFFMRSLYDLYKYIQNEPQFDKYTPLTFPKYIPNGEYYPFAVLSGAIGYGLYHDPQLCIFYCISYLYSIIWIVWLSVFTIY